MSRPSILSVIRLSSLTAVPFVGLAVWLALHKMGRVGPVDGLTYEATLILNLALYWLMATLALIAWRHRSWVGGWLRGQAPQIALLLFSLVFSLVFGEIAIRLLRPDLAARAFERLPSPTLHHVNAPDRSSLGMGNQRVVTNSDGFRSDYSRESFLEYEHRIVLLGDSYTFGLGVAGQEAVGAVLEERLREHLGAQSVAVLNTGVISYSPLLAGLAFKEKAAAYQPTLTLLLLDANDFGDDHQYGEENVAGPGEAPRFDVPALDSSASLCDFSALCRALGPVWDRLGKPFWVARRLLDLEEEAYDYYDFEVLIDGRPETNRFFILRYPEAQTKPYLDATYENIEQVAADVRAAGSDFALVVMPRYFHWNDAECPDNWEKDRYGVDEPYENAYLEYFDRRAPDASFPVWSLLEPFSRAEGPLVFDHDPHWNAAGHRAAGQALGDWLVEDGWPATLVQRPRFSFSPPAAVAAQELAESAPEAPAEMTED